MEFFATISGFYRGKRLEILSIWIGQGWCWAFFVFHSSCHAAADMPLGFVHLEHVFHFSVKLWIDIF